MSGKVPCSNVSVDKNITQHCVNVNDFVVVKFLGKRSIKNYIGLIISKEDHEYTVKYLRRSTEKKFIFPVIEDTSVIEEADIVFKLKQPLLDQRNRYYFDPEELKSIENLC